MAVPASPSATEEGSSILIVELSSLVKLLLPTLSTASTAFALGLESVTLTGSSASIVVSPLVVTLTVCEQRGRTRQKRKCPAGTVLVATTDRIVDRYIVARVGSVYTYRKIYRGRTNVALRDRGGIVDTDRGTVVVGEAATAHIVDRKYRVRTRARKRYADRLVRLDRGITVGRHADRLRQRGRTRQKRKCPAGTVLVATTDRIVDRYIVALGRKRLYLP